MSKLYPSAPFIPSTEDADDADDDICPVCDGECTCRNTRPQLQQPRNEEVDPSPDNRSKPLKIRLTVPPNLLHSRNSHQSSSHKSTSKKAGTSNSSVAKQIKQAKRRQVANNSSTRTVFLQNSSRNAKPSSSRKIQAPRRPQTSGRSGYPTFMPASALSIACDSESSDSSDSLSSLSSSEAEGEAGTSAAPHKLTHQSSSSSSDDDDDIFHSSHPDRTLLEEKARLRRELLGSQGSHDRHRRRFHHGGNARKDYTYHHSNATTSESEEESNAKSIVANDDDENQADEEEGGENDEADESDDESVGASRYIGFATGWSDDEESSFDADVFFAGLSDGSSDDGMDPMDLDQGQDADATFLAPPAFLQQRSNSDVSLQNALQAEIDVAESWDGQIVFTNKFKELQSRTLTSETSSSSAPSIMLISQPPLTQSEGDEDEDDGYIMSDGETTEEELVGADGLPTEVAMGLFSMPMSTSSDIFASLDTIALHQKPHKHRQEVALAPLKAAAGPCMGGFSHNVVTHPAHSVIEPSMTKDSIPRPFFDPSEILPLRRRQRQHSITDSSLPPSSPCVSSSVDFTSDAFDIDIDDFLNDTCSDDASLAGSLLSSAPEEYNHAQNLHRWDLISVGAFRTREPLLLLPSSPFVGCTSPIKTSRPVYPTSPLEDKNSSSSSQRLNSIPDSPTPIMAQSLSAFSPKQIPQKDPKVRTARSPREPKKPKKMKYRNVHQHYHKHLHYPNMKKRGTISIQRIKSSSTGATTSP